MSKRYKAKRRARYYEAHPGLAPFYCWCGARNPYFAPVRGGCSGLGVLTCHCGGDLCVCHNHGEVDCYGCADCVHPDDDDYDFYDDEDVEAHP